jgi:hypothetical protein
MFFSEEKNQKTFMAWACPDTSVYGRDIWAGGKSKSFLVLFFKKELLSW